MEMRWDDDGWHFEAMDFLMAELLSQVPACATVQDDAADARIFTSPTQGADRSDDQDWRENVVPELRELFQSYVDVVIGDLARMRKEAETSAIDIPAAHGQRDSVTALCVPA